MKIRNIIHRIDSRRAELPEQLASLTDRALSLKAGLSSDAIRNLRRRAEKNPDAAGGANANTISSLARVLETTESWLIHGTEATPDSTAMKMDRLLELDPAAHDQVLGLLEILLEKQEKNPRSD
ncbi:hypothetical protein [Planktotalea sp.]|uniref:hypothetical protein n=1 Tax=Planktotalea sp. TaxID=2029877 RepID=UPI003D6B7E51